MGETVYIGTISHAQVANGTVGALRQVWWQRQYFKVQIKI